MKKFFALLAGLFLMSAVFAADLPYDEKANADADVAAALKQAQASNKKVLLVFGANWCPDCRELDKALHGKSAAMIDAKFVVVKIDVGRFDKNMALSNAYGTPTKKGIPAAVMLTPQNRVLYATKGGELADARNMGETGIYDFFNKAIAQNQ
jgi:thioredoxin 1